MKNWARILSVLVIIGILLFLLYTCSGPDEPEADLDPLSVDTTPQVEEEEDLPTEATGEPTVLVEPDPEPEPDTFAVEPTPVPEAVCDYPGDGFTPFPHGFSPTGQYVAFDYPVYLSGYNGETLPIADGDEGGASQSVCVVTTYDVSTEGRPINLSVYDSRMSLDGEPAFDIDVYEDMALDAVESRRYQPGSRNDKPIRIDKNVMEVRFVR